MSPVTCKNEDTIENEILSKIHNNIESEGGGDQGVKWKNNLSLLRPPWAALRDCRVIKIETIASILYMNIANDLTFFDRRIIAVRI